MNSDHLDIPDDIAMHELKAFKHFSGEFMTKVFMASDYPEYPIYPVGTAGFLLYRGRYFLFTNYHVVKSVEDHERLAKVKVVVGQRFAHLIAQAFDKESDIAVFEIDPIFVRAQNDVSFLSETVLETKAEDHLEDCNAVFLHGYPGETLEIDHEDKIVDMVTFPYATFATQSGGHLIRLSTAPTGLSEDGTINTALPDLHGMSGSPVYCYYPDQKLVPFKCMGILTLGTRQSGHMWVINIRDVLELINNAFFGG